MQIHLDALDGALAADPFTGVITMDVADARIHEQSDGFAHRALRVPNTTDTRFAMASGSKTFTALAVMRLVEDGVLSLTTRARSILGDDLPLIDDAVTVGHLLSHTSGIGDYLDEESDEDPAEYVLPVSAQVLAETEAFVPVIDGYPQKFAPGERFSYCNGGFIVLALLAQRASGRGYHELVEEEVFARAGLRETGFLRSDDLPGDAALGYLHPAGNRTNVLQLPVRGNGDGGAYTTARDLHVFWQALGSGLIVRPDSLAEMTRPRQDVPQERRRYGLGMWLAPEGPELIMEGADVGVSIRSTHDPLTSTTVTVISNRSGGAWSAAAALIPDHWPLP